MLYAYGGRAPSARDVADREIYEMSLDLGWKPQEIRAMSRRDLNKLMLVKNARRLAAEQRNQTSE